MICCDNPHIIYLNPPLAPSNIALYPFLLLLQFLLGHLEGLGTQVIIHSSNSLSVTTHCRAMHAMYMYIIIDLQWIMYIYTYILFYCTLEILYDNKTYRIALNKWGTWLQFQLITVESKSCSAYPQRNADSHQMKGKNFDRALMMTSGIPIISYRYLDFRWQPQTCGWRLCQTVAERWIYPSPKQRHLKSNIYYILSRQQKLYQTSWPVLWYIGRVFRCLVWYIDINNQTL